MARDKLLPETLENKTCGTITTAGVCGTFCNQAKETVDVRYLEQDATSSSVLLQTRRSSSVQTENEERNGFISLKQEYLLLIKETRTYIIPQLHTYVEILNDAVSHSFQNLLPTACDVMVSIQDLYPQLRITISDYYTKTIPHQNDPIAEYYVEIYCGNAGRTYSPVYSKVSGKNDQLAARFTRIFQMINNAIKRPTIYFASANVIVNDYFLKNQKALAYYDKIMEHSTTTLTTGFLKSTVSSENNSVQALDNRYYAELPSVLSSTLFSQGPVIQQESVATNDDQLILTTSSNVCPLSFDSYTSKYVSTNNADTKLATVSEVRIEDAIHVLWIDSEKEQYKSACDEWCKQLKQYLRYTTYRSTSIGDDNKQCLLKELKNLKNEAKLFLIMSVNVTDFKIILDLMSDFKCISSIYLLSVGYAVGIPTNDTYDAYFGILKLLYPKIRCIFQTKEVLMYQFICELAVYYIHVGDKYKRIEKFNLATAVYQYSDYLLSLVE
ncbi:unnamed protein product [Didymodactylos carnosus]|uniref:Uncharacterized protein n=1 Tax=Didymodactylos carnosus TaxID=1234261 RepID=A0A8S2H8F8_9BILA|nr:unnamed protein product [Didymodactylos carnosus]CAF3614994.1 unnamed protein product [Didymodactylos carnosus]